MRNFLARNGKFYAPAYIKLYDAAVRNDTHLLEGVRKCVKQRSTAKGKANVPSDPAFIAEFEWVHNVWKGCVVFYHLILSFMSLASQLRWDSH